MSSFVPSRTGGMGPFLPPGTQGGVTLGEKPKPSPTIISAKPTLYKDVNKKQKREEKQEVEKNSELQKVRTHLTKLFKTKFVEWYRALCLLVNVRFCYSEERLC